MTGVSLTSVKLLNVLRCSLLYQYSFCTADSDFCKNICGLAVFEKKI